VAARPTLFVLHYDGGAFAGWQRQPSARTVQAEVERVLARLTGGRTAVAAAGRTDAGVHAVGQAAAAVVPERWTPELLTRAMNALLPPDVWVASAARMVQGFNPRRHAIERTYCYRIGTDAAARSPFRLRYEWHVPQPLDVPRLAKSAARLVGRHGFQALSAVGEPRAHYRCHVVEAMWQWREDGRGLEFWITADRFLHRMVRFLVGAMVEIARGRKPLSHLDELLSSTDNRAAPAPAPPQGLFLVGVRFPAHWYAEAS
jgi:tRNA pseudouridine38-40 synthase